MDLQCLLNNRSTLVEKGLVQVILSKNCIYLKMAKIAQSFLTFNCIEWEVNQSGRDNLVKFRNQIALINQKAQKNIKNMMVGREAIRQKEFMKCMFLDIASRDYSDHD